MPANLLLLLNDGAGHFLHATEIIGPRGVGFATTGDLNGDGRLDVAAIMFQENRVVILEGNGTGQFTETASYLTGTSQNHFVILTQRRRTARHRRHDSRRLLPPVQHLRRRSGRGPPISTAR